MFYQGTYFKYSKNPMLHFAPWVSCFPLDLRNPAPSPLKPNVMQVSIARRHDRNVARTVINRDDSKTFHCPIRYVESHNTPGVTHALSTFCRRSTSTPVLKLRQRGNYEPIRRTSTVVIYPRSYFEPQGPMPRGDKGCPTSRLTNVVFEDRGRWSKDARRLQKRLVKTRQVWCQLTINGYLM